MCGLMACWLGCCAIALLVVCFAGWLCGLMACWMVPGLVV